jgi:uncharacterized protein (DUF608 family)
LTDAAAPSATEAERLAATAGVRYSGDARRAFALPLGGLGAGHVAIAGDGSLRQWQLANTVNHGGFVPDSFFAVRLSSIEPPLDIRRTLRSERIPGAEERAPLVSDDLEPRDSTPPTRTWPPVKATEVSVAYPFVAVDMVDPTLPLQIGFEAWTPFVPLDAVASGLPLATFTFRLANSSANLVHGWLIASLQNAVGWDGVTPIQGNRCGLYGGNENTVIDLGDGEAGTTILMTNPSVPATDGRAGEMLLSADHPAWPILRATSAEGILTLVESLKLVESGINNDWSMEAIARGLRTMRPPYVEPRGASPDGTTWDGALAVPFAVEPGETAAIEFLQAWWFPNRMADFDQFGPDLPTHVEARIGNRYASRYGGAVDVARHFRTNRPSLHAASRDWAATVAGLDAPRLVAETLASQPSLMRSPTTFVDEAGRLFGFEGGLGASTLNWNGAVGGSCPLNCTHVWNYEQAIASIFPDLERTMRDVEWDVLQAPDGSIPHRVRLPLDGPQLHARAIGGPLSPALDGMLGSILKTYRDARLGGGRAMLEHRWEAMSRVIDHVTDRWAGAGDGILRGPQPMTYDIDLNEPNMYIGSLWIAAHRAMHRVATILDRPTEAARHAALATSASEHYDDLLWNGRYFGRASAEDDSGLGAGCLADQLNGQWWAHQLGLGYVLPRDHVRTALRTIVASNLRHGFRGWEHGFRKLADGDDTGLLLCTWPNGDRPSSPVRYADEVWTGVEYAVAALCLFEGMESDGLAILEGVRGRYDGTRRNPYNEIECGDHYSRAMSGWSLLQAWTGTSADVIDDRLALGHRDGRAPLLAGTAWGRTTISSDATRVEILGGTFRLAVISVAVRGDRGSTDRLELRLDGQPVQIDLEDGPDRIEVRPRAALDLRAGSCLELSR